MINLLLLGTLGCHLCEQAEGILSAYENQLTLTLIDIAIEEQWQEKYAVRIPVLYHSETNKELGWPFNHEQVQTFINQLENK